MKLNIICCDFLREDIEDCINSRSRFGPFCLPPIHVSRSMWQMATISWSAERNSMVAYVPHLHTFSLIMVRALWIFETLTRRKIDIVMNFLHYAFRRCLCSKYTFLRNIQSVPFKSTTPDNFAESGRREKMFYTKFFDFEGNIRWYNWFDLG